VSKISVSEGIWDLISKKWNLRILKILDTKTVTRFNVLKQSIHGLSSNVLSNRLDQLEKFGLIKKINLNHTSSHIGYILTERCDNLKKTLLELDNWISSYQLDKSEITMLNDSILSKKLFDFLKNEISTTEFNFIKDKLLFTFDNDSIGIVKNYNILKNIIFELFGEENGNKLVEKLNKQIESFKTGI
jgi:DNA-binding HxlR family transcriptional regulator